MNSINKILEVFKFLSLLDANLHKKMIILCHLVINESTKDVVDACCDNHKLTFVHSSLVDLVVIILESYAEPLVNIYFGH